ncbi:hypothetical protein SPRG_13591 [Saprolegnia parasitica CBS 223.65]|uniref:Uncharacterized protein n=1 Tax=Saprolegnia parasitica (strain CBS 223.65) TaxID=695850 RepID=A0A067C3C3_SAPPC|nr:hypothetical protein SPRG_13591 [Saprolegnia parasitica CBS 223.65]KDO21292.1 hypothetical protein SPRG_13591 [Saprolegnia parasitica CBS 223.65]|eukprot:XP_012208034.1 hypothetical protein SPRG_13591 [Saprolegnia parasitica CBS 223.65]
MTTERPQLDSTFECQYSYKPCTHPRSRKRNGSLHLLCDYHRKKANAIQRVYANKKRLERLQLKQGKSAPAAVVAPAQPVAKVAPPTQLPSGNASDELGAELFEYMSSLLRDDHTLPWADALWARDETSVLDTLL